MRDFFKFNGVPEFERTLTRKEWRDLHYSLGLKYAKEGIVKTGFLDSREFRVFTTVEYFPLWDAIWEGFGSFNNQTGANFWVSNMADPIIVTRKEVSDILKSRRLRKRDYGVVFALDFHDFELDGYVPSDDLKSTITGTSFPLKGIFDVTFHRDYKGSLEDASRLMSITTSHELSHLCVPNEMEHCNAMTWGGSLYCGR